MNLDKCNDNILLTIAIPTFNRSSKLKNLLNSIHSSLSYGKNSSCVEILVSDNCSTDKTLNVLKHVSYLPKEYKFTYSVNNRNYGVDRNYMNAALNSSGLFVWFLADDDEILDTSIDYLFNLLNTNLNVGAAFVNYFTGDDRIATAIPVKNDCYLVDNFALLTSEILTKYSMGSSVIIKTSLLKKESMIKYVGTAYPHMYWFANVARYTSSLTLIIRRPLFVNIHPGVFETRKNSTKRESYPFDFYLYAHLSYIEFVSYIVDFDLFPLSLRLKLYRENISHNLNQIIFHKITVKKYDVIAIKTAIKTMTRYFYLSPLFWLVHIPIILLPSFVAKNIEPHRWKYLRVKHAFGVFIRIIYGQY